MTMNMRSRGFIALRCAAFIAAAVMILVGIQLTVTDRLPVANPTGNGAMMLFQPDGEIRYTNNGHWAELSVCGQTLATVSTTNTTFRWFAVDPCARATPRLALAEALRVLYINSFKRYRTCDSDNSGSAPDWMDGAYKYRNRLPATIRGINNIPGTDRWTTVFPSADRVCADDSTTLTITGGTQAMHQEFLQVYHAKVREIRNRFWLADWFNWGLYVGTTLFPILCVTAMWLCTVLWLLFIGVVAIVYVNQLYQADMKRLCDFNIQAIKDCNKAAEVEEACWDTMADDEKKTSPFYPQASPPVYIDTAFTVVAETPLLEDKERESRKGVLKTVNDIVIHRKVGRFNITERQVPREDNFTIRCDPTQDNSAGQEGGSYPFGEQHTT